VQGRSSARGSGWSSRERDRGFDRGTWTVSTNSGELHGQRGGRRRRGRTPATVWASKECEREGRARVGRRERGARGGREEGSPGFYRERVPRRERYGRRFQGAIDGVHQWGEGVMGESGGRRNSSIDSPLRRGGERTA
jgi:hypothetical protein